MAARVAQPQPGWHTVDAGRAACEIEAVGVGRSVLVVDASGLIASMRDAFVRCSILSADALQDDERVRKAAKIAYDNLPMSIRFAVRLSVGEAGFERFVFSVRDLMVRQKVSDLSQLGGGQLLDLVTRWFAGRADPTSASQPQATARAVLFVPPPPSPMPVHRPAPAPPPSEWYVRRGDDQFGPFSSTEFLRLAEDGRLTASDLVWRTGLESWIKLSELPQLKLPAP